MLAIDSKDGRYAQWAMKSGRTFNPTHQGFIKLSPHGAETVKNISYAVVTRLPHQQPNVAYEAATILLHDKGFSLFRNGETVEYVPNCREDPKMCENKTLLFNLDQGIDGGLQAIAHADPQTADQMIDRISEFLKSTGEAYNVWALVNPIYEDRTATLAVLDRLAKNGVPFVLDFYSSDITNIAYVKPGSVSYKPKTFAALKGVSLAIQGAPGAPDNLDFYAQRYGKLFAGVRIFERLGMEINASVPGLAPLVKDEALARQELPLDWRLVRDLLDWSQHNNKYVIWSDPALYIQYECYWKKEQVNAASAVRDRYVAREGELATAYTNVVPVYDNNEGVKRCGVAQGDFELTPRNFRLSHWQSIPAQIASKKNGDTALTGRHGFGLSVQSWTADYDPVLNAGTLPDAEIAIWALDGFRQGASLLEFEPGYYFFAWPANNKLLNSSPGSKQLPPGAPLASSKELFKALGIQE